MPKISVVPTHEVMKIAEDQGMLPERYIGGLEKMLMPYELRYKDKNGKFLHDLKITRDDGTAFSIHEIESESEKLPNFSGKKIFHFSISFVLMKIFFVVLKAVLCDDAIYIFIVIPLSF